jgi:hypothetical protein
MIHQELTRTYNDIEELLLGELDEMVVMSRAGKGEVIRSMLKLNLGDKEREAYEAEMDEKSLGEKLKS